MEWVNPLTHTHTQPPLSLTLCYWTDAHKSASLPEWWEREWKLWEKWLQCCECETLITPLEHRPEHYSCSRSFYEQRCLACRFIRELGFEDGHPPRSEMVFLYARFAPSLALRRVRLFIKARAVAADAHLDLMCCISVCFCPAGERHRSGLWVRGDYVGEGEWNVSFLNWNKRHDLVSIITIIISNKCLSPLSESIHAALLS